MTDQMPAPAGFAYGNNRLDALLAGLGDACQEHFPGDYPATYPYRVSDDRGSVRAGYRCAVCGQEWTCWWDPRSCGWPRR